MDNQNPDRSQFLMFAALGYSIITFAMIFGSISSPMGVLSLPIALFLIALPLLAIISMATVSLCIRFHWAAMTVFVCWILTTAFLQLMIFAQAAASV